MENLLQVIVALELSISLANSTSAAGHWESTQTQELRGDLVTFSDFISKTRGPFQLYKYILFMITLNKQAQNCFNILPCTDTEFTQKFHDIFMFTSCVSNYGR